MIAGCSVPTRLATRSVVFGILNMLLFACTLGFVVLARLSLFWCICW